MWKDDFGWKLLSTAGILAIIAMVLFVIYTIYQQDQRHKYVERNAEMMCFAYQKLSEEKIQPLWPHKVSCYKMNENASADYMCECYYPILHKAAATVIYMPISLDGDGKVTVTKDFCPIRKKLNDLIKREECL